MALPTITERPVKDLIPPGGVYVYFVSRWNALHNPVVYQITNDKWPVSGDAPQAITGQADDNGNVQFTIVGHPFTSLEWVTITGSGIADYNGTWQIIATGINTITLDLAYQAGAIGGAIAATLYYQNYHTLIQVWAGVPAGHVLNAEDPIVLIATIKGRPDDLNITKVDVSALARDHISLINDLGLVDNDINLWAGIYIKFAESYDSSDGTDITQFTSAYTDDVNDLIYGVQAKMPFQNTYGGNMGTLVLNEGDTEEKFLTKFSDPVLWGDRYFDLSVIVDPSLADLYELLTANGLFFVYDEYDINQASITSDNSVNIINSDEGIYRLQVNDIVFSAGTDYILAHIEVFKILVLNPTFLISLVPWIAAPIPGGEPWVWNAPSEAKATDAVLTVSERLIQAVDLVIGNTYYWQVIVDRVGTADIELDLSGDDAGWAQIDLFDVPIGGVYSGSFVAAANYTNFGFFANEKSAAPIDIEIRSFFLWEVLTISAEQKVIINSKCENQSIYLTWINNLGGWDYWNFTAEKEYGIDVEDSSEFDANIFNDWDDNFINGETVTALETVRARNTRTVRSQFLTQTQVDGIANIKTSIRVQQIREDGTKITVLIDKKSFKIREDQQKLYTIEFSLRYTDLIPIQDA